jgi:hypothetical protein
MVKKVLVVLVTMIFALSMAGMVIAAEVKGTISKVGDGGKSITVKNKAGEETTYKVSKTTKFEGIASRDELKEEMKVTVSSDDGTTATSIVKR